MVFKKSSIYPFLEVSSEGVVRRVKDKRVFNVKSRTKAGYIRITDAVDGVRFNVFAHRLVAECWVGGYREGFIVNHLNGIKDDNRASNLEWTTQKENVHHALIHGLSKSDCSPEELDMCCKLLSEGLGVGEIARTLGINRWVVQDIKAGKWGVFSEKYDIPSPREVATPEAVHWICQKMLDGWRNVDIERNCPFPDVTRSTVSGIRNKLYFKDISSLYF